MLVFDLDHTLVHSLQYAVDGHDMFRVFASGMVLFVHVRPYAVEFLQFLLSSGKECGVWTAGTHEYMEHVLDGLFDRVGYNWKTTLRIAYSR